jgi:hypothetical protein
MIAAILNQLVSLMIAIFESNSALMAAILNHLMSLMTVIFESPCVPDSRHFESPCVPDGRHI